ncbi:pyruvate dehydrogenase E1 component alpha subunit [Melghirimyces profundicolus]|uniref:Pyruvate dehydrogenase E1 component subunit alpha n=2 Tax=Melghirimyces profundicolus TaxID=1242148 RepID=A0A2T6BW05_9BACL|nr:pyruvate dehydrogenase (acetyl-transferring) E1 component subunit alpha [Melghirimyces profundicolus]PTX60251.1 pyruvate dehydrogenase E1 component alpha subunit [Melghirimyces profundicolus]
MPKVMELKQEAEMFQILNENGEIVEGQRAPDLSDDELKDIYRWMLRIRTFDGRAIKLNRQGRLGFYAPMAGQEACQIASMAALKRSDWLFPSYRDLGTAMFHGLPMEMGFLYSRGMKNGMKIPDDVNMFPPQIIIAGHVPHAAGAGWAFRLREEDHVAIAFFGDGATSEGDFHEGLNFAGVYDANAIFFCQNNQYAISVPLSKQTRSETIAQKAVAYGIHGIQVDGNDALAVYQATKEAADRARRGEGPTLIEGVTYRLGPHTMAGDDPGRYRTKEEEENWASKKDPLKRFRKYLESKNLWSDEEEEKTKEEVLEEMNEAIKKVEKMPKGTVAELIEDVYTETPALLKKQKEEYLSWKEGK